MSTKPTELEELVEFLHHGNTQVRQIAAENLVGYSSAKPTLFKRNQLEPIKDLKLLSKDYEQIAKNALTMLINLTDDSEIVKHLIEDKDFIESLLRRITSAKDTAADLRCMLFANLAKSPDITKLLELKRDVVKELSTSTLAIDQLLDCFVKGEGGSYNKDANYDYLCYLFADLAKHDVGRKHFLTPQAESQDKNAEVVIPLTKLVVFTEHSSTIRRRGVASTIKNTTFDISSHEKLLDPKGVNILPYILLPLMGNEEYELEDTEGMLDECQLLPPDKEREKQNDIICIHLESLLLLTTTKEGRSRLREVKVYPIIRELHLKVPDEAVTEGCDRLVQVLMRGEEGDPVPAPPPELQGSIQEIDEDDQILDIV